MQFNRWAGVFTMDGREAGHIDRVVIDPKTNEVTHLVIRTGLLFSGEKVVPVGLIAIGRTDGVGLCVKADQLEQLPDFEETDYVAANEKGSGSDVLNASKQTSAPALYWYPRYLESPIVRPCVEPPYRPETQLNIPKGTVAVKEGARVLACDGRPIGHVVEILASSQDRVTHFVIRGELPQEEKLIPIGWVNHLGKDEVHLAIESYVVRKLPNKYHLTHEHREPQPILTRYTWTGSRG